jgi:hypothetical protein
MPTDSTSDDISNDDWQKKHDALWREFDTMLDELCSDLRAIDKLLCDAGEQVWRRSYCRGLFAMMEAANAWLKKSVVFMWWPGVVDDLKLKDKREVKLPDGTTEQRRHFLSFADNLFFAFDTYAWTSGIELSFDRSAQEWRDMLRANRIRNRLCHPKKPIDLVVTDMELALMRSCADWYTCQIQVLFKNSAEQGLKEWEQTERWLRANRPEVWEALQREKDDMLQSD